MSQSATLYRISRTDFENNRSDQQRMLSLTKGFATFDQTFMGLDFILKKGEDENTQRVLDKVFNPTTCEVNGTEPDFEQLSDDELHNLIFDENLIYFLSPDKVRAINTVIERFSKQEVASRFDPIELNKNGIYPNVWHFDNSPELSYNLNNILEDYEQLKYLFSQASMEEEYILQFIG